MFSPSLSQPVEAWLTQFSAVAVTDFFLSLLLVVFIVAFFLKPLGWLPALTHYTPTLLTSLGILGTFAGIIIGLLEFDPTRIDASITLLLNGLKTAFITSLAGMTLSILYKILTSFLVSLRKTDVPDEDEVGIGDLYAALKSQTESVQALRKAISENDESSLMGQVKMLRGDLSDQHKATATELGNLNGSLQTQTETVQGLQKAVGGDGESSLVGQFKLLRSDLSDQHKATNHKLESLNTTTGQLAATAATQQQAFEQFADKLWVKLQDFADMMAKSATEQVIEALKAAIADFNKNLTDQFGENFKALNEAVGKLLEWQENYKQQIHDMTQQYQLGVSAITQTEASVAKISTDAGTIPATMDQLKAIVEVNQHQLSELGRHLEAFKDIRDRAVEAAPEIRQHIDDTLSGVRSASETLARGMNENAEQIRTIIQSGAEGFQSSVEQVNKTLVSNSEVLAQGVNESVEQVKGVITAGAEQFQTSVTNTNQTLVQNAEALAQTTNENAERIKEVVQSGAEGFQFSVEQVNQGLVTNSDTLTRGVTESVEQARTAIMTGAEDFQNSVSGVNKSLVSTSDQMAVQSESIKQHLEDTITDINNTLRNLVADLQKEGKQVTDDFRSAGTAMIDEASNARRAFDQGLQEMRNNLVNSLEEMAQTQVNQAQQVFNGLSKSIEGALGDTGEAVGKQINMIDQAMGKEVERVMNEMGKALASISGQFTQDYRKLVAEMQRIASAHRGAAV